MNFSYLLISLVLLGLLIYRFFLDADGKASTRLLTLALFVGLIRFCIQTFLPQIEPKATLDLVLIASDFLYVLFFVLLALHYTSLQLPVVGYWIPMVILYLAVLSAGMLLLTETNISPGGSAELIRTMLFLSATLSFAAIGRSSNMVDRQPMFWIPSLIVAIGFAIASAGKVISTGMHFIGSTAAGLMTTISSLLGAVATILLLIFLTAYLFWVRRPV